MKIKVKDLIKALQSFDGEKNVVVSVLGTNCCPFPRYEKMEIKEIVPCYEQSEITSMELKPHDDIELFGFDGDEICICVAESLA